jgi:hypothetical protein
MTHDEDQIASAAELALGVAWSSLKPSEQEHWRRAWMAFKQFALSSCYSVAKSYGDSMLREPINSPKIAESDQRRYGAMECYNVLKLGIVRG